MYSTSQEYKTAITKNARAHRITGTVAGVSYSGRNILKGTFVAKNQMCPATAIELGGVYVGELDLTFTKSFATGLNIRGSWRGVRITASVGVEIGINQFEDIPVGVYTVESATWVDEGLRIVAYDAMSKFDKALAMDQTYGVPHDILTYVCEECDVNLGMTQAECEELPNGDAVLGIYPGSSMQTYRDLLSQLAAAMCCFATIDRNGALVFRKLPSYSDIDATVPASLRYSTAFSDYSSYYSSIEVENMRDDIEVSTIYNNDNIGGLSLELGANPLLQYGVEEVVTSLRQAIADGLEDFRAVPFSATLLPDASYDLGDCIEFTGGIGQGSIGVVMSITIRADSVTIEGYGENPTAAGVQSSVEKQISAAAKNQKDQGLTYYTFVNTRAVSLTTTAQRLYRIAFATADTTTVDLWHEIKWNITTDDEPVEITYEYYLDGVKFDYEPVDRYGFDGYDTRPHPFWLLDVSGGEVHYWEVRAKLNGGSAVASIGDIHAELRGQKLVGQVKFDGNIELSDEIPPLIGGQDIVGLSDSVISIERDHPYPNISKADTFMAYIGGQEIVDLSDDFSITREKEQFYLVTEDGDNLATEDGDTFIT